MIDAGLDDGDAGDLSDACHSVRRSWHDVEGSQEVASQTPIDVYSGAMKVRIRNLTGSA
jgi:hypothetical protein